jgi:hypothetical protein
MKEEWAPEIEIAQSNTRANGRIYFLSKWKIHKKDIFFDKK